THKQQTPNPSHHEASRGQPLPAGGGSQQCQPAAEEGHASGGNALLGLGLELGVLVRAHEEPVYRKRDTYFASYRCAAPSASALASALARSRSSSSCSRSLFLAAARSSFSRRRRSAQSARTRSSASRLASISCARVLGTSAAFSTSTSTGRT